MEILKEGVVVAVLGWMREGNFCMEGIGMWVRKVLT